MKDYLFTDIIIDTHTQNLLDIPSEIIMKST